MEENVKNCLLILSILINTIGFTSIVKADVGFENWKLVLRQQALEQGILPKVFDQAFKHVNIDLQVIKFDASQPEFTRSVWDYISNAISTARVKKGKALLQQHYTLFDEIENRYGVPREVITAIWAMESDFGRNYGNKNILQSLATLAYASSSQKRKDFALNELILTLKIIQTKRIDAQSLVGSWAGAMGQPQFMPSSYLSYGVDYDRDGNVDLWQTLPDIFASIANFLAESGWRANEHWGEEVRLPQKFDWRLNTSTYQLRYQQWQEMGLHKFNKKPYDSPQRLASLFIPAGKSGPVFLITHNFSVIKRYNQSSSYALAVAQLSNMFGLGDTIRGSWPIEDEALSILQVMEIQHLLNQSGHSVGEVDGKIGTKTKDAIRTWQLENGLAGDGYANLFLLNRLKNESKH